MWMDGFVMILYDFRGIYRIFWSQNSRWIVKKRCDLFLTVGFDFGSNLTVGSSYIRYKSFWTVRSSFRFKINRWIKNITVGF